MIQARYRRQERAWLIAWSITATILYACHAMYFSHPELTSPLADTIYSTCNLAVYPLYLLYIITLTRGTVRAELQSVPLQAILLGPALIGGGVMGLVYLLMDAQQQSAFSVNFLRADSMNGLGGLSLFMAWWHIVCRVVFAIEVVGVVLAAQHLIRNHDDDITMNYADTEGRMLTSVRIILWLLLGTAGLSVVVNFMGRHWFTDSAWFLMVPSVLFSILLSLIGWEGLMYGLAPADRGQLSQFNIQWTVQADMQPIKPPVANFSCSILATDIEEVLREKRLYLQHDLRLADLTEVMNTNRTYLWQALKDSGTTFSDLVNSLRIEYAVNLMHQQPDMSLSDVYVKAGYASPDSFYRHFRNIMHCTPHEYAKKLQNLSPASCSTDLSPQSFCQA